MKEMVGGCCVCSDERGWPENPLVYCDGQHCTVAVHQACYGIVTVPTGPWYCRKCESQERSARVRCELCPSRDGALKKTDNSSWAHVVCALYIPEVRFGNVTTMEPIILQLIPQERYSKVCYICQEVGKGSKATVGACMQCNKSGCKQQFHVTCAQALGLLCEEAGNYLDNVKYCGYCQHHYSKLKKGGNVKTIPPYKPVTHEAGSSDSPSSPEKESETLPASHHNTASTSASLKSVSHHSNINIHSLSSSNLSTGTTTITTMSLTASSITSSTSTTAIAAITITPATLPSSSSLSSLSSMASSSTSSSTSSTYSSAQSSKQRKSGSSSRSSIQQNVGTLNLSNTGSSPNNSIQQQSQQQQQQTHNTTNLSSNSHSNSNNTNSSVGSSGSGTIITSSRNSNNSASAGGGIGHSSSSSGSGSSSSRESKHSRSVSKSSSSSKSHDKEIKSSKSKSSSSNKDSSSNSSSNSINTLSNNSSNAVSAIVSTGSLTSSPSLLSSSATLSSVNLPIIGSSQNNLTTKDSNSLHGSSSNTKDNSHNQKYSTAPETIVVNTESIFHTEKVQSVAASVTMAKKRKADTGRNSANSSMEDVNKDLIKDVSVTLVPLPLMDSNDDKNSKKQRISDSNVSPPLRIVHEPNLQNTSPIQQQIGNISQSPSSSSSTLKQQQQQHIVQNTNVQIPLSKITSPFHNSNKSPSTSGSSIMVSVPLASATLPGVNIGGSSIVNPNIYQQPSPSAVATISPAHHQHHQQQQQQQHQQIHQHQQLSNISTQQQQRSSPIIHIQQAHYAQPHSVLQQTPHLHPQYERHSPVIQNPIHSPNTIMHSNLTTGNVGLSSIAEQNMSSGVGSCNTNSNSVSVLKSISPSPVTCSVNMGTATITTMESGGIKVTYDKQANTRVQQLQDEEPAGRRSRTPENNSTYSGLKFSYEAQTNIALAPPPPPPPLPSQPPLPPPSSSLPSSSSSSTSSLTTTIIKDSPPSSPSSDNGALNKRDRTQQQQNSGVSLIQPVLHQTQKNQHQQQQQLVNTVSNLPNSSPIPLSSTQTISVTTTTTTTATTPISLSTSTSKDEAKDFKIFQNGVHATHMLGNQLNPNSSVAQKLSDQLDMELEAHSVYTTGNADTGMQLIGPSFPGKHQGTNRQSSQSHGPSLSSMLGGTGIPTASGNTPQSLEQLLERQWEQGSQFLMEQAQHFDIASLLSCLHQLRSENLRLEEHVSDLITRRDHLLAVNARLAIPLNPQVMQTPVQFSNIHLNGPIAENTAVNNQRLTRTGVHNFTSQSLPIENGIDFRNTTSSSTSNTGSSTVLSGRQSTSNMPSSTSFTSQTTVNRQQQQQISQSLQQPQQQQQQPQHSQPLTQSISNNLDQSSRNRSNIGARSDQTRRQPSKT